MQVDKVWIDKYKGKFDTGWDAYRESVLANQKKLGLIPDSTTLHPRHERIKAWDSLSADERKLMARSMEAHAGFLSQTDHEIGRVVDFIRQLGQLDNTLIFVIIGDNGATKFTQSLPGLAPEDEHYRK
jgi:arylsulfatase